MIDYKCKIASYIDSSRNDIVFKHFAEKYGLYIYGFEPGTILMPQIRSDELEGAFHHDTTKNFFSIWFDSINYWYSFKFNKRAVYKKRFDTQNTIENFDKLIIEFNQELKKSNEELELDNIKTDFE
jgi:hypothetical protein